MMDDPQPLEMAVQAVSEDTLYHVAKLFHAFKQLRVDGIHMNGIISEYIDESLLNRAFDIHLQGVLSKLGARLLSQDDVRLKNAEITMAKHGLFDSAFQQAISVCCTVSPILGESLKDIRSIHTNFMTDLQQSTISFVEENRSIKIQNSSLKSRLESLERDNEELKRLYENTIKETEIKQRKVVELREQLRETTVELAHLRDVTASSNHQQSSAPNVVKRGLQRTNSSNSLVNKSMSFSLTSSPPLKIRTRSASVIKSANQDDDSLVPNHSNSSSTINSTVRSGTGSLVKGPLSITSPVSWLNSFRQEVQSAMDSGRCRDISLRECKELIEKLCESKSLANEKAIKGIGNIPMETMEQHTFRCMEKKYGLRNLAVEHVGMFLQAIESYCEMDNDVAVFQKIFRNEVEEDFRVVQKELLKSIRDMCMVKIMERNPNKDQPTLQALLDNTISSGIIFEDDWREMVNYLYNESDSTALCRELRRLALLNKGDEASSNITIMNNATVNKPQQPIGYDKQNLKDVRRLGYSSATLKIEVNDTDFNNATLQKQRKGMLKLPYSVYIRTVLDYQLRTHQDYLSNFLRIFRRHDKNVDGVINAGEFRDCYMELRSLIMSVNTESSAEYKHENDSAINNRLSSKVSSEKESSKEENLNQVNDDVNKLSADEMRAFLTLIKTLDPVGTDRIIFSSAITCINHINTFLQDHFKVIT